MTYIRVRTRSIPIRSGWIEAPLALPNTTDWYLKVYVRLDPPWVEDFFYPEELEYAEPEDPLEIPF